MKSILCYVYNLAGLLGVSLSTAAPQVVSKQVDPPDTPTNEWCDSINLLVHSSSWTVLMFQATLLVDRLSPCQRSEQCLPACPAGTVLQTVPIAVVDNVSTEKQLSDHALSQTLT